jgi:hypothetical protein
VRELIGVLTAAAVLGLGATATSASAIAGACGQGIASSRYAYAGEQAKTATHGVRATITPLVAAPVTSGHVAAWVGVGGLQSGPRGADVWLQAGVASVPDEPLLLYAEVMRSAAASPSFIELKSGVEVGESHRLAVLEMQGRPNWWRVWLDGRAATKAMHLSGSSGTWQPIATAESQTTGAQACPVFAFRFAAVQMAASPGGSWHAFSHGRRILDGAYRLRLLSPGGHAAFSFEVSNG